MMFRALALLLVMSCAHAQDAAYALNERLLIATRNGDAQAVARAR